MSKLFEILPRDWNLKPIFTQKWASVDMNWGVPTTPSGNSNPANSSFQQPVHARGKWVCCQYTSLMNIGLWFVNEALADWDARNLTELLYKALINLTILSGISSVVSSNQSDDRLSESKATRKST